MSRLITLPRSVRLATLGLLCLLCPAVAIPAPSAPAQRPYDNVPFVFVGAGVEAFPGGGRTVTRQATTLFVRLTGEALLSGTSPRLLLDDRDVSGQCRREGPVTLLSLPSSLSAGAHTVEIELPSLLSGTRRIAWTFTVAPTDAAKGAHDLQVGHNARRTLNEGDVLEVRAEGPPGGRGQATIGHLRLPLREVRPGAYTAVHEIQHEDYCVGSVVDAEIVYPDGRLLHATSPTPVKIFGQVFTVRVLTPQSGERVPWDFVIKGRTRPNSVITVTPMFGGGSTPVSDITGPPTPGSVSRNIGTIETRSDEHGYFTQKFGFPLHLVDVTYGFKITAIDPQGNQALPATFRVVIGNRKPPAPNASGASKAPGLNPDSNR